MDSNRKGSFILLGFIVLMVNIWFWMFVEMLFGVIGLPKQQVVNITIMSFFAPVIFAFIVAYCNELKGY